MEANGFNKELCAALRSFMLDHEVNQQDVAGELSRSTNYVSQRLRGIYPLTVDIFTAVAVLSHVSPRALMVEITSRMGSGQD